MCGGDKDKQIVSHVKNENKIEVKLMGEICFLYNAEKLMVENKFIR